MKKYRIINARRTFKTKDKETTLSKKEWDLLNLLHSKKGAIVSKQEIAVDIWGAESKSIDHDQLIEKLISRLRNSIGEDFIRTYRGHGYSFGAVASKEKSACVYLMSLGFENLYKIGRGNALGRLNAGRAFNPKLKLVALAFTDSSSETERKLHKQYAHKKIRNEVFELSKTDVNSISDYLDSLYDI